MKESKSGYYFSTTELVAVNDILFSKYRIIVTTNEVLQIVGYEHPMFTK